MNKLTSKQLKCIDSIEGLGADNFKIYCDGKEVSKSDIYTRIPNSSKLGSKSDCYNTVREYLVSQNKIFNPQKEKEAKRAEKEAELEAKRAEKEAKKQEKQMWKELIDSTIDSIRSATDESELMPIDEYISLFSELTDIKLKNKAINSIQHALKTQKLKIKVGEIYNSLMVNNNGEVIQSQYNVNTLLEQKIRNEDLEFAINEFNHIPTLNNKPIDTNLSSVYNCEFGSIFNNWTDASRLINHSIVNAYDSNAYDSVIDAFDEFKKRVKWDGVKRAATKIGIIGADVSDSPIGKLNKKMFFNTLYAFIHRQYHPGAMFDHILQLQDATGGTGKTRFLERITQTPFKFDKLGLNYVTTLKSLTTDRDNVALRTNSVAVILDENAAIWKNKNTYEPLKCELTKSDYQQRSLYKNTTERYLVRNIYFGTCNNEGFIGIYDDDADVSERRLWLVECHGVRHTETAYWKKVLSDNELEQIWAEMFEFYENNPDYEFNSLTEEEDSLLAEIQHNHRSNIESYIQKAIIDNVFYLNYYKLGWGSSKITKETCDLLGRLKASGYAPVEEVFRFELENTKFEDGKEYTTQEVLDEFKRQISPSDYQCPTSYFKNTIGEYCPTMANRTINNLVSHLSNAYRSGDMIRNKRSVSEIIDYKIKTFCDPTTFNERIKSLGNAYRTY